MSLFACQQGYHAPSSDTSKQNTGCACYERTVSEGCQNNYWAGIKSGTNRSSQDFIDRAVVLISVMVMPDGLDDEYRDMAKEWLEDIYESTRDEWDDY